MHFHKLILCILFLFFLASASKLYAQEFSFTPVKRGSNSYDEFLDSLKIPKLELKKNCFVETLCGSAVTDQNGKKLRDFSGYDSVKKISEGRYQKAAYMLISRSYTCGKKGKEEYCQEYLFFQSDGNIFKFNNNKAEGALASKITEMGEVLSITGNHTYLADKLGKTINKGKSPEKFIGADIAINVEGVISALAIAESGVLYIGDGFNWTKVNHLSIPSKSDRRGILSVYPKAENEFYLAIYRYTNAYNKGLYLMHINIDKAEEQGGWLFNSEDRNIGFDPEIYLNKSNNVIISATNSSTNSDVSFSVEEKDVNKLSSSLPKNVVENGFANKSKASFMIGAGISKIKWEATSKVEKGNTTYTNVDYLIADTLFVSANAEGSVGETSITASYLQNQAEDLTANEISSGGGKTAKKLSKKASRHFFSTIDFQELISPSSSLRIQVEVGETNGIAKVKQNDGSVAYQSFSTKLKRLAALVIKERGVFYGADYLKYTMPSAVGFSDDSKNIVYSDFDRDFGFQSLRGIVGYDALAYAKRYETNYSRLYWSGSGNFGLGWPDISSKVERAAKTATGASKMDDIPTYYVIGCDLEAGYLWQQRSKKLGGFGYSASIGYRVNYIHSSAGQDKDSKPDKDTLYLEFEREDLMHGPFFKANVIF